MNGAAAINHQIPSLKAGNACNGDKNDNSNPQQGTGGFRSPQATRNANDVKTTPLQNDVVLRPAPKIPPTAKDSRKLFVGGLPADITDDEFQSFFARFGPVMDSVVMFDRDTGRSRGFGFVTFEDPGVCQHILSLGNQDGSDDASACIARLEMRGKVVEIKAAEPKQATGTNSRRVTRGPTYSLNKGSHFRSVTNEPYMEHQEFAYSYSHAPLDPYLFGDSMPNQYMYPAPTGFVAPMYYNGGLPPINYQNQFSVGTDDPNQLSGNVAPHKFPNSYSHGMMESPSLLMPVPYAGYPQVPPYAHALPQQVYAPDVAPPLSGDNSTPPFVPGVSTTADEIESTE